MKIFNAIQEFSSPAKTVVTLGTFDGVHLGHRRLLDKLIKNGKELGCPTAVLTFFPHPRMVLQPDADVKMLNTITEKAALLEESGIDNLIIHPFSREFSRLTAEDFVKDILVKRLNIAKIIIGHDHRFGRNRTATTEDLVRMGKEFGFEVEQITALDVDDITVSSTKIRHALTDGQLDIANNYLGYPYFITGTVTTGKQLGRTIGYPTANIATEDYKLIPNKGVYAVSALINNTTVYGMMNIGTRPTVDGTHQTIEVNFFDLDANLYDTELKISLHHRLRNEQKFDGIEALKIQLAKDKQNAIAYFNQQ
ncbi:bifunctional riboflavin kinase/FAD synthetase [Flavobacterium sp. Sd200]|uniref:bifunctional riboflavin kinase/FAD synthetase n=1 Tax=Flavobacterium sp. Sd200 TaxID=2692211 RepID=UPI001371F3CF|nr:bifunctional riboflavin kinase/FAD synthetase [Flavobacterium sp. Sd200]MXN91360.1 bifunctional riboflavin kinase/FAD synthetase [Flavobacterium sp. Sd200]